MIGSNWKIVKSTIIYFLFAVCGYKFSSSHVSMCDTQNNNNNSNNYDTRMKRIKPISNEWERNKIPICWVSCAERESNEWIVCACKCTCEYEFVCGIVCCDMCSVCLHRDPSNAMLFVRNYFISFVNKFEDEKKALHKQTPNSVDKNEKLNEWRLKKPLSTRTHPHHPRDVNFNPIE